MLSVAGASLGQPCNERVSRERGIVRLDSVSVGRTRDWDWDVDVHVGSVGVPHGVPSVLDRHFYCSVVMLHV